MTIMLNGSDLTVTDVVAAARYGAPVALAPGAVETMEQAREVVAEALQAGAAVYGLTTGVGERKSFLLDPAERQRFNHRLVLNHRIAQGDVAPADVVRGAMVCLANSYAKGDGIEDRATMAPLSARRLADMVSLCARVAAIELVVAAQAIDLRAPGPLGLGTGHAYRIIRELVPFTQADGTLPADLEPLTELVSRGDLHPDNMAPRNPGPPSQAA
jgi:histidine ammonia-lyase